MARTTHVKAAQQRYETKPVLDENGQPVKIALTNKDGSPKMTRAKGSRAPRPVFITKTVADKSRPKPLLSCDFPGCGRKIEVGEGYKWIKPKSGPYGGRMMARHAEHPGWNRWDYSHSLSANLERISHDAWAAIQGCETPEDVTEALSAVADDIRSLAEEKRDGARNIEDGFGHATSQSEELEQTADDLDGWADEVEGVDVPALEDYPTEDAMVDCPDCGGTGQVERNDDETDGTVDEDCPECDGTGEVEDDEPEPDLEAWMEAVQDVCSIVDESPV